MTVVEIFIFDFSFYLSFDLGGIFFNISNSLGDYSKKLEFGVSNIINSN